MSGPDEDSRTPRIRPVELTRLTADQAGLGRALARRQPRLSLSLPDGTLELHLAATSGVPAGNDHPALWLDGESGRYRLGIDPGVLRVWLTPWIGDRGLDALPAALAQAARQAALSPLLDALESLLATRLTPSAPGSMPSPAPTELGLWRLDATDAPPLARLWLDRAASVRLAPLLERIEAPGSDPERWPTLSVELTPWLGRCRLTATEWRTLEVGDVLLIAAEVDPEAIPLHLRQQRRTLAAARLSGQRLIVDSAVSPPMSDSTSPNPEAIPVPATLDPDDLEVEVEFELGALRLPLSELHAIRPGYCFELPELDRPRVRLVVSDRLIGYGELVMVEEHLGVLVSRLIESPATK
ncbi:type III secretion system cytoplasmic ring protein SctQ [Imhoffiella purpurea]|uniref:Type III secretion inner membrane protein n=1 Tax=Imhoffiella purpurea TaxID=1249627 RepID=W9VF65_9GAMM|nr:type III secretion system cytoplasmic ring protein SctQ [Imhoffiella purpurea]EXJ15641.1 Type III secretion inner membrane protein [Imhoffiella purpurea]